LSSGAFTAVTWTQGSALRQRTVNITIPNAIPPKNGRGGIAWNPRPACVFDYLKDA
jgi:hypothetical protein